MLYAPIEKRGWESALPPTWDKVRSMFDYLNRMTWEHQIEFQTKLFNTPGPSIQCALIRWENATNMDARRRTVLLETSDPAQMEAALFMLISEAEAQYKAAGNMRVSMVP